MACCEGMSVGPSGSACSSFTVVSGVAMLKVARSVVLASDFGLVHQHETCSKRSCKQHNKCIVGRTLVSGKCRAINWIKIQEEPMKKWHLLPDKVPFGAVTWIENWRHRTLLTYWTLHLILLYLKACLCIIWYVDSVMISFFFLIPFVWPLFIREIRMLFYFRSWIAVSIDVALHVVCLVSLWCFGLTKTVFTLHDLLFWSGRPCCKGCLWHCPWPYRV